MTRPWTYPELERLRQLRLAGISRRIIASQMNRSFSAIAQQCFIRGFDKAPTAPVVETVVIFKHEVCDFYERGFRFDGFATDGRCVMVRTLRHANMHHHEVGKLPSIPSADSAKQLGAVG